MIAAVSSSAGGETTEEEVRRARSRWKGSGGSNLWLNLL